METRKEEQITRRTNRVLGEELPDAVGVLEEAPADHVGVEVDFGRGEAFYGALDGEAVELVVCRGPVFVGLVDGLARFFGELVEPVVLEELGVAEDAVEGLVLGERHDGRGVEGVDEHAEVHLLAGRDAVERVAHGGDRGATEGGPAGSGVGRDLGHEAGVALLLEEVGAVQRVAHAKAEVLAEVLVDVVFRRSGRRGPSGRVEGRLVPGVELGHVLAVDHENLVDAAAQDGADAPHVRRVAAVAEAESGLPEVRRQERVHGNVEIELVVDSLLPRTIPRRRLVAGELPVRGLRPENGLDQRRDAHRLRQRKELRSVVLLLDAERHRRPFFFGFRLFGEEREGLDEAAGVDGSTRAVLEVPVERTHLRVEARHDRRHGERRRAKQVRVALLRRGVDAHGRADAQRKRRQLVAAPAHRDEVDVL
mmetsp:Transcript_15678/g.47409  ORF Transcript_15678/g.47409 Transcript_15678/m.47409 type:complete len:423 (-) Transcript_15678:824-2092(-)